MTPAPAAVHAFADAFIAAVRSGGATSHVSPTDPVFTRLTEGALHYAREHWSKERDGQRLEPIASYAARHLAPWAYDHEPAFAAYANRIDQGGAWFHVWTPACAAAIQAAKAAKIERVAA